MRRSTTSATPHARVVGSCTDSGPAAVGRARHGSCSSTGSPSRPVPRLSRHDRAHHPERSSSRCSSSAWRSPPSCTALGRAACSCSSPRSSAWALGSMSVNAASLEAPTHFPATGRVAVPALLPRHGRLPAAGRGPQAAAAGPSAGWTSSSSAAAPPAWRRCCSSRPIRVASGQEGLPLLLALVYPLADMMLAMVVLGQALLAGAHRPSTVVDDGLGVPAARRSRLGVRAPGLRHHLRLRHPEQRVVGRRLRPARRRGLSAPAAGDQGRPQGGRDQARRRCRHRRRDRAGRAPHDSLAYYIVPPAVLTLAAVAARMGLALRDANRAAEAFALSQTDDLTKLPNRRAVRARMAQRIADGRPLALMLLDLDGFKEINDALGHQAGDVVLKFVAVRIRESVSADVMVARLGGDEFAILLGSTDEIELMETARESWPSSPSRSTSTASRSARPARSASRWSAETDCDGGRGAAPRRRRDVPGQGTRARARRCTTPTSTSSPVRGCSSQRTCAEASPRARSRSGTSRRSTRRPGRSAPWRRWFAGGTPREGLLNPVAFLPAARRAGLMGALSDDRSPHRHPATCTAFARSGSTSGWPSTAHRRSC